jgi:hypothetical protein
MLILRHEKPFNKWFMFGYRYFGKTYLYKPVWDCEKCFGGQCALWVYLYNCFYCKLYAYNVWEHLYFVCLTILVTFVAAKLFAKMEK